MSTEPPAPAVLTFRYTCARHQQRFIEAVQGAGCCDPAMMEWVRRHLLAWFSQRYPRLVLDHFHDATCLGCEIEARFGHLREIGWAIRDLVNGMADAES